VHHPGHSGDQKEKRQDRQGRVIRNLGGETEDVVLDAACGRLLDGPGAPDAADPPSWYARENNIDPCCDRPSPRLEDWISSAVDRHHVAR
jgi:hypothetical protein